MRAPKILPRVASQAGISEELALKLWRRAASETELLMGESKSSEYYRLVVEQFLLLVDDESGAALSPAPRLAKALRHQSRMSQVSMAATQNVLLNWRDAWQKIYRFRKAA
jgi:hypothetical protein